MKKTKALSFNKETIRTLSSRDLRLVGGGYAAETGRQCQIVGNATGSCESTEASVVKDNVVNVVNVASGR